MNVSRRTLIKGATAAGVAGAAGCASSRGEAVNVDEAKVLSDASDISFGRDASVSWINERFIEYDSPDHPAIGTELSCSAMVLTNLQAEEERLQMANELQWANFEFAGNAILGPLFEPISWILDPAKEFTESFYEQFELMKLVGITETDQRFYDKYEFVPYVWAVGDDDVFHPSGTVVDVTGTVRYAQQGEDGLTPGMGDGVYFELSSAEPQRTYRDLTRDTEVGESASFAGLQYVEDSVLTTHITEVDYTYERDFPKPEGGSLVAQTGEMTDSSFEVRSLVRDNNASLLTSDQRVIVGTTHRGDWDAGSTPVSPGSDPDNEDDRRSRSESVNTVAVIDVSGSMDESDTRSGKTRLQVAKESTRALVNFIETGNRLGIVSFSATARSNISLRDVGNRREDFHRAVSELSTRNDTSIGAGLAEAVTLLESAVGPKSIVLLSDGKQNEPPTVSEIMPELSRLGITVYAIGLGSEADRALLRRIAEGTGGEVAFAPTPSELRSLYQRFSVSAQGRSTLTSTQTALYSGETVEGSARVDQTCRDCQFSVSHEGDAISLEVHRPNGEAIEPGSDVSHRLGDTSEVWTIENPESGDWRYRVTAGEITGSGTTTVEVSADSPIEASFFVSDEIYEQTGMAKVEVKAKDKRLRYTDADVTLAAGKTDRTRSDGSSRLVGSDVIVADVSGVTDVLGGQSTQTEGSSPDPVEIQLRDDGGGPDPVANDGIYTGYLHVPEPGEYNFQASISGGSVGELNREFTRSFSFDQAPATDEPIIPYEDDSGALLPADPGRFVGPVAVIAALIATLVGTLRIIKE